MPNYKGHLVGGACTYALVLYVVVLYIAPSFLTAFEWLLLTLAGSLFPDIDIKSKGQKYFYATILGVCLYLLVMNKICAAAMLALISFIPLMVRHRGITHQWWFVLVVPLSAVLVLVGSDCGTIKSLSLDAFFFICGAWSHIALDRGVTRFFR